MRCKVQYFLTPIVPGFIEKVQLNYSEFSYFSQSLFQMTLSVFWNPGASHSYRLCHLFSKRLLFKMLVQIKIFSRSVAEDIFKIKIFSRYFQMLGSALRCNVFFSSELLRAPWGHLEPRVPRCFPDVSSPGLGIWEVFTKGLI